MDDANNKAELDTAVECYKKALELIEPGNVEQAKVKANAAGGSHWDLL